LDFFSGKKVLVAGAAGFVGTHLTQRLVSLGAIVRGTIHNSNPLLEINGVEYVRTNLETTIDCDLVTKNIDYVFMCAANSSGAEVMTKTPLVHLTPNVIMNSQILAASYANNVKKFCFISSNTVYPLTDFAVSEGDVTGDFFEKYFIVGWMKRFSEIVMEIYSKKIKLNKMITVVIRPGNLYGPLDKYKKHESKVIAALIRRAYERENPFEVWGDGQDIKDFLYIDDFIDALLETFAKSGDFDVFNIASGVPVTIKEVLKDIIQISQNQDIEVKFDTSKPTMIPIRMIDISKIKKEISWKPKISIYDGLKQTYEWYSETYRDLNPEGQKI
jgi:GDP-L-fucose synthase